MKVKDVMTPICEMVNATDNLHTAAQRMRDQEIGMLAVGNGTDNITGLLTDRDITIRAIANGASADSEVRHFMSTDIISCKDDDDLQQAADIMEREQIRRLLVLDRQNKPCGILAQSDLARALGRSPMIGEMLRDISQAGGEHVQH